jgi:6-phosphogluconolactonase
MNLEVLNDAESVAAAAAAHIARAAREAVALRGRASIAVSGGTTPGRMLELLSFQDVPWRETHFFQVDERVGPAGHPDRNLAGLLKGLNRPDAQIHPMPVEADLERGVAEYARELELIAGRPPALDLVHLGLGTDGHTASLVPGDPALEVRDYPVALTGVYQGRRRMTLTFPVLDQARQVLWVVTGAEKRLMVERLLRSDQAIPAGRVRCAGMLLLVDQAAAGHA